MLLFAAAALSFGLAYVRRYRGGRLAFSVQYDLRNDMHDHLHAPGPRHAGRLPTGQLVSRASSDSALVQGLLSFLPLMTGNVLMMVLSIVVMFVLSPLLALLALVVVPALFVVSYRMRRRVFPATWDGQQREGDVAQIVDEGVTGVRVVKAFGQEQRELRRLAGTAQRALRLAAARDPAAGALPAAARGDPDARAGGRSCCSAACSTLHGTITIGTFLAFSTYVGQFAAPARQLAGILTIGQQARAGVERIFQLLDLRSPPIADAHRDAVDAGTASAARSSSTTCTSATTPAPRCCAASTCASPPASGWRSSAPAAAASPPLAALLTRFYDPTSGAVCIDGRDLRGVTLHSLRSTVGTAFEESFLFSDTIRANIAYGRPGASEAEIVAAAQAAQAHDFVTALAQGVRHGGRRARAHAVRRPAPAGRARPGDPRPTRRSSSSTTPPAPSTRAPRQAIHDAPARRARPAHHAADRPPACPRCTWPSASSCSTPAGSPSTARTPSSASAAPATARCVAGLDDDPVRAAGDGIEALAALTKDGVTSAAWRAARRRRRRPAQRREHQLRRTADGGRTPAAASAAAVRAG